ncbi:MAG: DNA gyrase C-terminal beta-propeller domain-containing protein, partial [Lachnospiraceae bacterium]
DALKKQYEETTANIYKYEDILDRKDSMAREIIKDLDLIKKQFSRERRTVIDNVAEAVVVEKPVEEIDMVFLMDRFGYCRVIDTATYERNKEAADTENSYIVNCKNTGKLCVFTNKGNMHSFKVSDLPYGKFRDKGLPIDNVSGFDSKDEDPVLVMSRDDISSMKFIFVSKQSMIKYVDGSEFDVAKKTVAATKLNDDDELKGVCVMTPETYVVMASHKGYLLKIDTTQIPEKKKAAVGVRGMKLGADDHIEEVFFGDMGAEKNIVKFHEKHIDLQILKPANRDGKGSKMR